jgi:hypothetical protein
MRIARLVVFSCLILATGATTADFVLENADFELGLDGWTVMGNGTLWSNDFNNSTHFFGYNGSSGDTMISQIVGDERLRSTGEFTLGADINTYDNKVKLGLRWWLTPDMSDQPGEMWFDWDLGDHTNTWQSYLDQPIVGDLGVEPYWIEVRARLCQLDAGGDCHNFIDDFDFSTPTVPEPAALTASGLAMLSLLGIALRRR